MVRPVPAPQRRTTRSWPCALVSLALATAAGPAFAQDSDGDGVLDALEDRNANQFLDDDNTDGDELPDWLDDDDDGDGFATRDEDWNGNGDWFDDDQGGYEGRPDFQDAYSPLDDDGDLYVDVDLGGDDCDDTSDSVNPDAFDQWYDGRDANCRGDSDYDQDGDGFDNFFEGGGEDCDDRNALAYPGAVEDLGGEDLDCDEFADPANPLVANGGCDCRVAPGPLPVPLLAALVALLGRRR